MTFCSVFRNMELMLKAHDIYILLAIAPNHSSEWTYDTLSAELGIAKSEAYRSLQRSASSHLFAPEPRRVRIAALLEFISHGIRYAFAVEPGATVRGVPTAWSAPGLEDSLVDDPLDRYVWPHPEGTMRGRSVAPLHRAAVERAREDVGLHRRLALCDAIRLGGARERGLASRLLAEEVRS